MTRVKICGITSAADAKLACELGAAALGFNFYEKSPRSVAPAEAWRIILRLPGGVEKVGVFVNWTAGAVIALGRAVKLTSVQLHGGETPANVKACSKEFRVSKAFRVGKGFRLATLRRYPAASAFLFDAAKTGQYGGTGQRTDWELARRAAKSRRIILAGGLTPENVAEAIRAVRPWAVDVASGVESRPGKKERGKMREFFAEVARANREIGKGAAK